MPLPFNHTLQRHALERLFNHWRNTRSRSMSGQMLRTSKQAWAKPEPTPGPSRPQQSNQRKNNSIPMLPKQGYFISIDLE
ncbi:hypothetical protein [Allofranklinella schreckenbergeri]|uniref:hypothetical protein n=1 Tax=Allofranklinella schreckenbergeri TaxID=1076744 RepID=UPI0011C4A1BD|nr:hypothetical protein [Allofranklinella schreckenbergeri]